MLSLLMSIILSSRQLSEEVLLLIGLLIINMEVMSSKHVPK